MASFLPLLSNAALPLALLVGCARDIAPPGGQQVEVVASLAEKPGNPAVTSDGRLIFTMHPLNRPTSRLMERRADGSLVPFPDSKRSQTDFDNPLGIRAAADGTLWILDMGNQAGAAAWPAARPPRLVGWDLRAEHGRARDPAVARGAAAELLAAGLRPRPAARHCLRR